MPPETPSPVSEADTTATEQTTTNERFLRVDNFTSNVQCTNVNIFCCNEKKGRFSASLQRNEWPEKTLRILDI